jgi:anti-sigma factor RsiW
MHPDDATWLSLLDGELSPSPRAGLERHVARCLACRRRVGELEQARDEVDARLELLDSRPPLRTAEAIRRRARPRGPRRLLAASILLAFATAAGATIQSGLLPRLAGRSAGSEHATTGSSQGPHGAQATSPTGIALRPNGAFEIRFGGHQKEGTIRIVLADRPTVSIVASAAVPYAVERGRVTVTNQDASASYTITLPRALSRVTVRIGDETVFTSQGGSIVAASAADSAGAYVIPLARAPR